MTDMLVDRSRGAGGKKYTLHRCYYCSHDKYPQGKVIMPFDKNARKTEKGDFMCGVCSIEMNRRIVEGMQRHSGRI
jgi:hypothetical protein